MTLARTLYFDCETFSECDLKLHGTHRYAEHPSTEIMVAQWALDDDEPSVEDLSDAGNGPNFMPAALHPLLLDPTVEIVAHNSAFDRTLIRHCWGVDVPPERWRDTMVKALAHGLPGALGKIGAVLGFEEDQAKDKRGTALIQIFCKPRPKGNKLRRATRDTHPTEWQEFLEYSRQDITAMRAIDRALPSWNYRQGHAEITLWHLDQRINDRGFATDLDLAHAAIAAANVEKARLKAETVDATNGLVSGPTKRDDLLRFILLEYGVDLPDMKADTLRRRMEDPELPDGVKLLMSLRLDANKTSTAKYQTLVRATSSDGRLRNGLQFAGALRTSRWAGRLFQPHNMSRPSRGFDVEMQELAIHSLKAGTVEIMGGVMQLLADCVRGCIVAPPGKKLVVADLANIEGRKLAWLAGEDWKLQAFRDFDEGNGPDMYKLAYARAFGIEPSAVDSAMRQIGKVMELALGYEGGVAAFLTFAAVYTMDLDKLADAVHRTAPKDQLARAYGMHEWATKKNKTMGLARNIYVACEVLKHAWREAHPATTQLWEDAKLGVTKAILHPGTTFDIGRHIKARVDGAWLRVRLPSGRYCCYLQPKVDGKGQISYMGVNQYTRQWCRIKSYGGKFVENWTQASSRDVLASSMQPAEDAGYPIVLTVHDELLTEPADSPEFSVGGLVAIMSTVPPWAKGLPLAAAGHEGYRYVKV
jgi:DNA polymerase